MTKEEETKLINGCKDRMNKAYNNLGKKLTDVELAYLGVILEDEIKTIITKCTTGLPTISPHMDRIQCLNGKSVVGWHLFKGTWEHVTQIFREDGTVDYYTGGLQETRNLRRL